MTAPPLTQAQHIERIKAMAHALADALRDASDAGVSHAVIVPQLVVVFKQSFGEPPPGLLASIQEQGSR